MKTKPAYLRIKLELKDKILSRGIESLSESKIIQDYGVSVTTSRRVLNELEDEGLIERKIGIGSVVRDGLFDGVKEYGVVFFDIFDPSHPYISGILRGMEDSAREKGDHLHLYTTRGNSIADNRNHSLHYLITKRQIDGLFLLSPLTAPDLRWLDKEKIPFVSVGNEYEEFRGSCVRFDYGKAIGEVFEVPGNAGLKRAGFILGEKGKNGIKRSADIIMDFYRDYVASNGLDFSENLFKLGNLTDEKGRGSIKEFYSMPSPERPEIVFVVSHAADGVLKFAKEHADWNVRVVPFFQNPGDKAGADYIFADYYLMGEYAYSLMEKKAEDFNSNGGENLYVPMEVGCSSDKTRLHSAGDRR